MEKLQKLYHKNHGTNSNRLPLLNKIREIMEDEIMLFSSLEVATVIMMRTKAADNDQDNIDAQIKMITKRIASETKFLCNNLNNYFKVDKDNFFNISQTLLNILSYMSKNLRFTVPAAVIRTIITNVLTSKKTMYYRQHQVQQPTIKELLKSFTTLGLHQHIMISEDSKFELQQISTAKP